MSCCAPCLFCCVSNAQKVDIVMSQLGSVSLLSQIEETDSPQLIVGRIVPVKDEFFLAPATGKSCIYYQTIIEELIEKMDGVMIEGEKAENDKVWVNRCMETKAADFVLVDPAFPGIQLYVPGGHFKVKALASEDDLNGSLFGKALALSKDSLTPAIKEMCARNNFSLDGKRLENIRIREASFQYAEQAVVLGIVKDVTDPTTHKINKVMLPVDAALLTDTYFSSKNFSTWTRQSLLDLCKVPTIVLTEDEKYFKGIQVGKLKKKMECAAYVDVQHIVPSSSTSMSISR